MFENVPTVYMPLFYIDQVVPVSDELAPTLILIQDLPDISQKMAIITTITGGIFTFLAIILLIMYSSNSKKESEKDSKFQPNQENVPLNKIVLKRET